jgi:hypothetical protein
MKNLLANQNLNNSQMPENWVKVPLATNVELHYRPAQTPERERQIDRMVKDASRFLNRQADALKSCNQINWIGSLELL